MAARLPARGNFHSGNLRNAENVNQVHVIIIVMLFWLAMVVVHGPENHHMVIELLVKRSDIKDSIPEEKEREAERKRIQSV